MIKSTSLRTRVIKQKYLPNESIEEWIRSPRKTHTGVSVIWKAVVMSFLVIETNLAWNIDNGRSLRIGEDPWIGCDNRHLLLNRMVAALQEMGSY